MEENEEDENQRNMIFPLDNRYFITDFWQYRKKDEEESLKSEQELQQKKNTLSLDESFRIKDACNDVVIKFLKNHLLQNLLVLNIIF